MMQQGVYSIEHRANARRDEDVVALIPITTTITATVRMRQDSRRHHTPCCIAYVALPLEKLTSTDLLYRTTAIDIGERVGDMMSTIDDRIVAQVRQHYEDIGRFELSSM